MSQPECPVCVAIAAGGRIRLTEESAQLLEALLRTARRASVRDRRAAINSDDSPRRTEAERALRLIDSSIEEIERTQSEKGWHGVDGQLQ